MTTRPLKKRIYGNCTIQAPDGEPICKCDHKKIKWYLDRDLATLVEEDPPTIRLKFEPKGRGNAGDQFYMTERRNLCVCCGTEFDLTRHHVVPHSFRKYFPDHLKSHSSHDVVLLCIECHSDYENHSQDYRKEMAKELGISPVEATQLLDRDLNKIKKYARAILKKGGVMPQDRADDMMIEIMEYLGNDDVSNEHLKELSEMTAVTMDPEHVPFSKRAVEILGVEEITMRWRRHFLETADPDYLPDNWDPERPVGL